MYTSEDGDDVSINSEHVLFRPEDMKNVPEGSCGHDNSPLDVMNHTLIKSTGIDVCVLKSNKHVLFHHTVTYKNIQFYLI